MWCQVLDLNYNSNNFHEEWVILQFIFAAAMDCCWLLCKEIVVVEWRNGNVDCRPCYQSCPIPASLCRSWLVALDPCRSKQVQFCRLHLPLLLAHLFPYKMLCRRPATPPLRVCTRQSPKQAHSHTQLETNHTRLACCDRNKNSMKKTKREKTKKFSRRRRWRTRRGCQEEDDEEQEQEVYKS